MGSGALPLRVLTLNTSSGRGPTGAPLGPQARRILPLLGALSLVRTLGMIAFATGLGALIAALAIDGFAAQAAQGTTSSQGLAEFIGTGLVRIDGLLPGAWLGDGPWWSWPGPMPWSAG